MALFVGLGILALLVLLLLTALLSRIYVRFRYYNCGATDRLVIVVRALYGAYQKQLTIPSLTMRGGQILFEKMTAGQSSENDNTSRQQHQAGKTPFQQGKKKLPRLRKMLKKIECTRFRVDFRVGTGDAATTGIVSGLLWGVLGCAIAMAEQWLQMRSQPYGSVKPNYRAAEFDVVWEFDCRVRVGTVVAALMFGGIRIASMRQSWNNWHNRLQPS